MSALGFASSRQEPRLPSCVRWVVLLKAVLPALVPEMSYEGMAVANGQDAGLAWESLVRGGLDGSRARQDQEGSAGLLRAGHAGIVKTPRSS